MIFKLERNKFKNTTSERSDTRNGAAVGSWRRPEEVQINNERNVENSSKLRQIVSLVRKRRGRRKKRNKKFSRKLYEGPGVCVLNTDVRLSSSSQHLSSGSLP